MSEAGEAMVTRVGLIGSGIRQSLSPALHEAEGAAHGLGYRYELFDLEDEADGAEALPRLLDRLEAQGFAGANITHPVKQRVIPLLTSLSAEAGAMGAVNAVRFAGGRREGHNSDWWGFGENLARSLGDFARDRVLLLGAGGAGAAAAYALGRRGAGQIEIVDTDILRAKALAARLCDLGYRASGGGLEGLEVAMARADGLVHATPTGMARYPGMPVERGWLRPAMWVAEIVYVPLETVLLRAARAAGCRTADGGGMVVLQAARGFEIFTGRTADPGRMLAHFATLIG